MLDGIEVVEDRWLSPDSPVVMIGGVAHVHNVARIKAEIDDYRAHVVHTIPPIFLREDGAMFEMDSPEARSRWPLLLGPVIHVTALNPFTDNPRERFAEFAVRSSMLMGGS